MTERDIDMQPEPIGPQRPAAGAAAVPDADRAAPLPGDAPPDADALPDVDTPSAPKTLPDVDTPSAPNAQSDADTPPAPDAPPVPPARGRAARVAARRARHDQRAQRLRRRWHLRLVWLCCLALALLAAGVWGLGALQGRTLALPDWMRDEITARIDSQLAPQEVGLGAISVAIEPDFTPRLILRDVDLRGPDGTRLAGFDRAEAQLSKTALMRGQLHPKTVQLSGATLRLRRMADGSVDVGFGDGTAPLGQAATLRDLLGAVDDAFLRPALQVLARVEVEALTLRYDDLGAARGWTADGGRIRLERAGAALRLAADVAILTGDDIATIEASYQTRIGATAAQLGVSFADLPATDIAVHSPALAWLSVLRAPISGALRVGVDDAGDLTPLSAALHIGAGALQPRADLAPVGFERAQAYMTYDPGAALLRFDDLSVTSPWVSLRAEGDVTLAALAGGVPQEFIGQLQISDIRANPAGIYPAPVRLDGAEADLRLRLAPFTLELGQLALHDEGQTATLSGRVAAVPGGWSFGLGGRMQAVDPARVLALWPETVIPRTREWLAANLHSARLRDIEFAWRQGPEQPRDLSLGFSYDEAAITYLAGLPTLESGEGHASLHNNRFVIETTRGFLEAPQGGQVDAAGTALIIPDVRIRQSPAQLRLASRGSVPALLSVLDLPPFGFITRAGQSVDMATGQAEGTAVIDLALMPGLQPGDVAITAEARLTGVQSDTLVPGRSLRAAELRLTLADNLLRIEGPGQIGRVGFDAAFVAPIGPLGGSDGGPEGGPEGGATAGTAEVTGRVTLSPAFLQEFNITLPPGAIAGEGQGRFTLRLPRGAPPEFALQSDLRGLRMRLDALGWSKGAQAAGQLRVAGVLSQPPRIDQIRIEAPGLLAEGALVLTPAGQLERARFARVRVGGAGGWLDAPGELIGRGRADPAINITGGRIDLRRMPDLAGAGGAGGGGGSAGGGAPITLALDRLQVSDAIALTRLRGEFRTAGGFQGPFTGLLNGQVALRGQVVPRDGRSAVRILSDNAGGVFAAAGLLRTAQGGSFDLTLLPAPGGPGAYDGILRAEDMRLRDAPAIAELFNAVSVVGLLDQMTGSGILFSEVDARFRLTPQRLTLLSSSAFGASMGISMDGYFDVASGQLDMQGVFSPIYMLNAVGSVLTRRGEGLIGFNYTLRGSAEAPRVQVNPLSVLTPGMFREIFRRPVPQVAQ